MSTTYSATIYCDYIVEADGKTNVELNVWDSDGLDVTCSSKGDDLDDCLASVLQDVVDSIMEPEPEDEDDIEDYICDLECENDCLAKEVESLRKELEQLKMRPNTIKVKSDTVQTPAQSTTKNSIPATVVDLSDFAKLLKSIGL